MIYQKFIMITIFADKYLYNIDKFLPEECDLNLYNPADGLPENLEGTDALLIRTVTLIDEPLVNNLPDSLQFIATGSAGTDHVNTRLLDKKDIAFADAGGCNSRAVAEYVATSILLWSDLSERNLNTLSAGIIGKGHVGTEVSKLLENLGINTICYDPPKEEREESFKSASLEDALSADILTLHVPLKQNGDYPTYHWLDEKKLEGKNYELVINTARGGVIDEQMLLKAHIKGSVKSFIIDVWENEPIFNDLIANNAFIKTPHIAGYSKQSKLRASKYIGDALCKHFSLETPEYEFEESSEAFNISNSSLKSARLSEVLCQIHPVKDYENELSRLIGLPPEEKGRRFNKLRSEFPLRNEFQFINMPEFLAEAHPVLKKLGS